MVQHAYIVTMDQTCTFKYTCAMYEYSHHIERFVKSQIEIEIFKSV